MVRSGCYAIWSLPNPKAWIFDNVRTPAFSQNPFEQGHVQFSSLPVFCAVISSSLFLWFQKSALLGFKAPLDPLLSAKLAVGVNRGTPGCVVYCTVFKLFFFFLGLTLESSCNASSTQLQ